jgi:hypothetical protein
MNLTNALMLASGGGFFFLGLFLNANLVSNLDIDLRALFLTYENPSKWADLIHMALFALIFFIDTWVSFGILITLEISALIYCATRHNYHLKKHGFPVGWLRQKRLLDTYFMASCVLLTAFVFSSKISYFS